MRNKIICKCVKFYYFSLSNRDILMSIHTKCNIRWSFKTMSVSLLYEFLLLFLHKRHFPYILGLMKRKEEWKFNLHTQNNKHLNII